MQRLVGEAGAFAEVEMSPITVQRPRSLCRSDGGDEIFLALETGSDVVTRIGASEVDTTLRPGTIQIMDFSQPLAAHWKATVHRGLHVYLPRATVGAALRQDINRVNGLILSPHGLAPLLASQMRTLAEHAVELSPLARTAALEATIDLALTALLLDLGRQSIESETCEDGLFTAACCFIDRNLASPDLTPERIAARLRCSRAHLYRVFARHELTIADYIREARLQRCRVALEATTSAMEAIADIAFRFGFENPVYFSRLFRLRFGLSPHEARRRAA